MSKKYKILNDKSLGLLMEIAYSGKPKPPQKNLAYSALYLRKDEQLGVTTFPELKSLYFEGHNTSDFYSLKTAHGLAAAKKIDEEAKKISKRIDTVRKQIATQAVHPSSSHMGADKLLAPEIKKLQELQKLSEDYAKNYSRGEAISNYDLIRLLKFPEILNELYDRVLATKTQVSNLREFLSDYVKQYSERKLVGQGEVPKAEYNTKWITDFLLNSPDYIDKYGFRRIPIIVGLVNDYFCHSILYLDFKKKIKLRSIALRPATEKVQGTNRTQIIREKDGLKIVQQWCAIIDNLSATSTKNKETNRPTPRKFSQQDLKHTGNQKALAERLLASFSISNLEFVQAVIEGILSAAEFSSPGKNVSYKIQSPPGAPIVKERKLLSKLEDFGMFKNLGEDGVFAIAELSNVNIPLLKECVSEIQTQLEFRADDSAADNVPKTATRKGIEKKWDVLQAIWESYESASRPESVMVPIDRMTVKGRTVEVIKDIISGLKKEGCFKSFEVFDRHISIENIDHDKFPQTFNKVGSTYKKLADESRNNKNGKKPKTVKTDAVNKRPLPGDVNWIINESECVLKFKDGKKLEFNDKEKPSAHYFEMLITQHGIKLKNSTVIKKIEEIKTKQQVRNLIKVLRKKVRNAGLVKRIKFETEYKSAYSVIVS